MCTVVILRRPGHDWPLILAANRDEMRGRPWKPPARHWPDRPEVIAGLDELAGGTWLGVNDHGLVAAIMNRPYTLGPEAHKRSRGELPLEALDHADAADAVEALSAIDGRAYRPFNLAIADSHDAFWLKGTGHERIEAMEIPHGVSMITAWDLNDRDHARIRAFLPRFEAATPPDPETGDWSDWETLMASRIHDTADGPRAAMTIVPAADGEETEDAGEGPENGFGTVSSALIALPAPGREGPKALWRFCPGPPGTAPYQDVEV